MQLPAAYRSLSRPSSAPDAKAFTLCSCSLELFAKDFLFCCSRSLNCLSFFVHFRFAVKKLSLFHRFVFRLVFADRSALHSSKLYLLPYFLERPIFSSNICPQYLFVSTLSLYSVFNEHGSNHLWSLLNTLPSLIPSGDTESIFKVATRDWLPGIPGLVEMKGIEPLTPCLQGRCSPS